MERKKVKNISEASEEMKKKISKKTQIAIVLVSIVANTITMVNFGIMFGNANQMKSQLDTKYNKIQEYKEYESESEEYKAVPKYIYNENGEYLGMEYVLTNEDEVHQIIKIR